MLLGLPEAREFLFSVIEIVERLKIPWELFYNLDETSVDKSSDQTKQYSLVGQERQISTTPSHMKEHVTEVLTTCADGTSVKSAAIFPTPFTTSDIQILSTFAIYNAPSGYINKDLFLKYIKDVFIPEIKAKRLRIGKPNSWALLIVDNHESRYNWEVMQLLLDNNIILFAFLPHTSQIFQPNDQVVNGVNKSAFTKKFAELVNRNPNYDRTDLLL